MIRLVARALPQNEWNDLVSGFQDLSLMQTWEYATAKAGTGPWKVARAVFMEGECIVGAVQALVRPIPWVQRGLVWVNRGPLWRRTESGDSSSLVRMMEELRYFWVEQQHMYLRIAAPYLEREMQKSPLGLNGYEPAESSGWVSARLDLFSPLETIRSQLQQKWRNCLNKAERLGLDVQFGCNDLLFGEFIGEYKRMLAERPYETSVTPSLLSRFQGILPSERKLCVLTGRQSGQLVGAVLIARYGQSCEYLAGAVNKSGRAISAGQLLLWHAVCEMKNLGCRWFDVGGMDPQHTPGGIFHFKAGMGGVPYRLVGEMEAHDGSWLNKIIRSRVSRARQRANA